MNKARAFTSNSQLYHPTRYSTQSTELQKMCHTADNAKQLQQQYVAIYNHIYKIKNRYNIAYRVLSFGIVTSSEM